MEFPKRKPTRLKNYDYSECGAYFITICTQGRRCLFSHIVGEGLAPPEISLTTYGRVADQQINQITSRYPHIAVDHYVIMPNHIHMLLLVSGETGGSRPSPTVVDAVRAFKSITTRLCGAGSGLFQRSFYDHIIRGEADYREIWEYIECNPINWRKDRLYAKGEDGNDLAPSHYRR